VLLNTCLQSPISNPPASSSRSRSISIFAAIRVCQSSECQDLSSQQVSRESQTVKLTVRPQRTPCLRSLPQGHFYYNTIMASPKHLDEILNLLSYEVISPLPNIPSIKSSLTSATDQPLKSPHNPPLPPPLPHPPHLVPHPQNPPHRTRPLSLPHPALIRRIYFRQSSRCTSKRAGLGTGCRIEEDIGVLGGFCEALSCYG
jgi:hypothetical protein